MRQVLIKILNMIKKIFKSDESIPTENLVYRETR